MKAIVFDFGNVIGFFDHHRATDRLAKHSDLSSEAIRASLFGGPLEDEYEAGLIATPDYLKQIRDLCQLRCSDEELTEVYGDIFWPNQPVCDLIPTLKPRYQLILGSNTTELHTRKFTRQFAATLLHFDALVLSYAIGVRKPKADFFVHCQRLAGCAPENCLFIDDLPVNVAGARDIGWHGIVYRDIHDLRQRLLEHGVVCGA